LSAHDKQFIAEVQVLGQRYGRGQGRSKQIAEKEAARDALIGLGLASGGHCPPD
jgi:ribonuclease III